MGVAGTVPALGQALRFGAATAAGAPRPSGPSGQEKGADPAARPFPSAPPQPVLFHGQALAQGPAAQHVEPRGPARQRQRGFGAGTRGGLGVHVDACVAERNTRRASVNWQFSLDNARQKLTRHYQKVYADNSPD